jgi:hypothetical protein
MPRSKGLVIGFWIVTALFCLVFYQDGNRAIPELARMRVAPSASVR